MAGSAATLHTGVASPEITAGQPKFEADPQISEGFLVGGIVVIDPVNTNLQNGHQIRLDRYTMADGNIYEMEFTQPSEPRSDTAIVDTTPWLVGREGFNAKVNGRFNDMGYPTIFVSPVDKALAATLRDSVHNMDYIVSHVLKNSDLRPSVLGYGSSRAAAIALGLGNMEYTDVIAPCFPRPPKAEELPETIIQAGFEAVELGRHLLRIGPRGITNQRKTFSKKPADWQHYLKVIPKLWNGDAGRLSWTNHETPTHITLLDKDGWSQADIWEGMTDERPNMTIKMMKGRHMRIPDPKVLAGPFHRFDALAEMRGIDGDFNEDMLQEVRELDLPPSEKTNRLGNLSLSTIIKAGYGLAAARA